MIYLLKYWKYLVPLIGAGAIFFYGFTLGQDNIESKYQRSLTDAQEVSAKKFAKMQVELLETESQLLDDVTATKVVYKNRTKEVIRYVKENKGVGGVDLNKCILSPDGMRKITDAFK